MFLIVKKTKYSNKINSLILSLFWLWMGVVYQAIFFSPINPAAKVFAALFILQGILFFYVGVIKEKITFDFKLNFITIIGLLLTILGTVIYPVLGYTFGHVFPYSPTFGLPCPTTIFTFGILLMSSKFPRYLVIIPFVWSIIGFTAANTLGIKEDVSLLISGLIGVFLILLRNKLAKN